MTPQGNTRHPADLDSRPTSTAWRWERLHRRAVSVSWRRLTGVSRVRSQRGMASCRVGLPRPLASSSLGLDKP